MAGKQDGEHTMGGEAGSIKFYDRYDYFQRGPGYIMRLRKALQYGFEYYRKNHPLVDGSGPGKNS